MARGGGVVVIVVVIAATDTAAARFPCACVASLSRSERRSEGHFHSLPSTFRSLFLSPFHDERISAASQTRSEILFVSDALWDKFLY